MEFLGGCIGDIGVYSFQQFKQITSGEGGAIVTNNSYYFERMRNYSDMGAVRDLFPNWNEEAALIGQNYRMNNLSATTDRVSARGPYLPYERTCL